MKRMLERKFFEPAEHCDECGSRLLHSDRIPYDDPYVGEYDVRIDCGYCPNCKSWVLHDNAQMRRRIQEIRGRAALEKYPFSEESWMPVEDAALMGLDVLEDFEELLYVVERGGRKYALRKSVELLLESLAEKDVEHTGLFRLED